jgi:N-acetyl-anhydromuramyl-L-alanine amidase AmpD
MGEIIIANQRFDIDARVVNFTQSPFWNATVEQCVQSSRPCVGGVPFSDQAKNKSPRRYALRPQLRKYGKTPPLDATKAVIRQFVLHHDGCWSAEMCWNVLHNERGLSCHFLIDNDGTIFQTIDLAFMAYHAAEFNVSSIGVEFCSRGDATKDPNAAEYRKRGMKRDTVPCKINGHTIMAYQFAPAQYDAFRALARSLTRLLPNLPVEYPQDLPGKQSWKTMPTALGYAGYMGHYHCTTRKWDPGPFDFKAFCEKLRGQNSFPLWTGKRDEGADRPVVPSNGTLLNERTAELLAANEKRADGGFYPVGPWGEYRLWHGGVHLRTDARAPVFAPFPGRLVAARMSATSAAGSCNFALLRHDMMVGQSPLRFYSLYMHLQDELAEKDPAARPAWLAKDSGKAVAAAPGKVALVDEPIEAGEIIGRVGTAGPPSASAPQIHFEIFSTTELLTDMPSAQPWTVIDGSSGGRTCDLDEVNEQIDGNRDRKLDARELTAFFAGAGGGHLEILRRRIAYNISEWTAEPGWEETLRTDPEFRDIPDAELQQLIADQITPTLWWTPEVAKHAKLPLDGCVYHYHPISFLHFVNEKIVEAAQTATDVADASEAREVPPGVVDDLGDETGESAVSDADLTEEDPYNDLTYEQMLQGFEGDPLAQ